jgi:hypothetical protein
MVPCIILHMRSNIVLYLINFNIYDFLLLRHNFFGLTTILLLCFSSNLGFAFAIICMPHYNFSFLFIIIIIIIIIIIKGIWKRQRYYENVKVDFEAQNSHLFSFYALNTPVYQIVYKLVN